MIKKENVEKVIVKIQNNKEILYKLFDFMEYFLTALKKDWNRNITSEELDKINDFSNFSYKKNTRAHSFYDPFDFVFYNKKGEDTTAEWIIKNTKLVDIIESFPSFFSDHQYLFQKDIILPYFYKEKDIIYNFLTRINLEIPSLHLSTLLTKAAGDTNNYFYYKNLLNFWNHETSDNADDMYLVCNEGTLELSLKDIELSDTFKINLLNSLILTYKRKKFNISSELKDYLAAEEEKLLNKKKVAQTNAGFAKMFGLREDPELERTINLTFNKKEELKKFKKEGYESVLTQYIIANNLESGSPEKIADDFNEKVNEAIKKLSD